MRRHVRSIHIGDLRRFRDPLTAGVGVLANLELAPDEVLGLRVGDVAEDGSSLRLRASAAPVPAVGRPLVRALRISRLRAGAAPTDYLLADEAGPMTAAKFASVVFAALETISVWLPWDEVRDRPAEDERWLLERGIAVGWLARTERDDAWRHRLHPPAEVMAEVIERLREAAIPSLPRCACAGDHPTPDPAAAPVWPSAQAGHGADPRSPPQPSAGGSGARRDPKVAATSGSSGPFHRGPGRRTGMNERDVPAPPERSPEPTGRSPTGTSRTKAPPPTFGPLRAAAGRTMLAPS